ncbi:hypothetical protein TELCIR_16690, partial [Teladorsagia circumcincta]
MVGEDENGKDDFKLGKFTASSAHYFEPYYGKEGDGDVTKPENINSLEEFIMKGTNDVGVDLMMADGGFSVEGQENIQLLVSLCIVREGGVFFCKLFDVFTPFRLAERQSTYLQKYLSFARNSSLIDKDQGILREDCLKHWLVPNKTLDRRERGAERQQIDPDQYFGRFTRKFYGREDFSARLPPFAATLLSERTVKELRYAEFSLNMLSNRASTQPELLISTGIVPKIRLGWGNHERYVVPPQLVVAGVYSFDQLAQSKNPLKSERPTSNCDREAPLFYFADVCAGPGGFSEYMLWRKAFYNVKGFGFTLK